MVATTERAVLDMVDIAGMQSEVQRVTDAIARLFAGEMTGKQIPGNGRSSGPLRAPSGRMVSMIDTHDGKRSRNMMGFFARDSWNVDGESVSQIGLSTWFLGKDPEELALIIGHELIHAWANAQTIPIADTSRQNRWHNAKFRALVDLVPCFLGWTEDAQVGTRTHLSDAGRTWLREEVHPFSGIDAKVFKVMPGPAPRRKPTTLTATCEEPTCEGRATVTVRQFSQGLTLYCAGQRYGDGGTHPVEAMWIDDNPLREWEEANM